MRSLMCRRFRRPAVEPTRDERGRWGRAEAYFGRLKSTRQIAAARESHFIAVSVLPCICRTSEGFRIARLTRFSSHIVLRRGGQNIGHNRKRRSCSCDPAIFEVPNRVQPLVSCEEESLTAP